ncbi:MAG: TonB-dependent copper receptor [Zoogloeaceae bacterium]|jgi:iron complex outermembrane receptor protein|nr:TonB-dependent copper receptor [Zoogloeaceae bacterium]
MYHIFRIKSVVGALLAAFATTLAFPSALHAQEASHRHEHGNAGMLDEAELEPIVITAPFMETPLEVHVDAKAPQQPLPPNDGASFLKTIPGMSVVRKGGTSGDPMFRGMAASRLNILLDGGQILGGCGGRMDPPTAYIFPDAFDRVTLTKGPQSVRYGPGASAGTVRFERDPVYFFAPGWQANSAVTGASFGRHDVFLDAKAGSPFGYVQGIVTHARSGDYEDGDGKTVHSRYERHSATAILGWTPDENTSLQFSAVRSDARAAYADRGMDGSRFRRENHDLKFEKSMRDGILDKVEAQVYHNTIDHLMDNYHLRHNTGMAMASNPDRRTTGGRFALTFLPHENLEWVLGVDQQSNRHTGRSGGASGSTTYYRDQKRVEDARFAQLGLFSEIDWAFAQEDRLIAGLRADRWRAKDSRQRFNLGSGMMPNYRPNPSANARRTEHLYSGFVRYEHDFSFGTAYAGLGHSERAPDFWEVVKEAAGQDSTASLSVFDAIAPEKTTQLDLGLTWKSGPWKGFVSAFYGRIDDYILIQSNYTKPGLMSSTRAVTIARNIDATTWGGEAGIDYRFSPNWKGMASLAYVHGTNDTDGHALGQMPPLEGRLGLDWESGPWSAGALLRLAARQNRVAVHEGNIVGQDLGKTAGFGVFSLNGGYRWNRKTRVTFGIDNLFNKTYAEAISKSGALIQGYEQTTRVNEPGRAFWLKAQFALE